MKTNTVKEMVHPEFFGWLNARLYYCFMVIFTMVGRDFIIEVSRVTQPDGTFDLNYQLFVSKEVPHTREYQETMASPRS